MRDLLNEYRTGLLSFASLVRCAESRMSQEALGFIKRLHDQEIKKIEDATVERIENCTARWVLIDVKANTAVAYDDYGKAEEAAYQIWSKWLPADLKHLNPEEVEMQLIGTSRYGQIGANQYAMWNYLGDDQSRVLLLCSEGNEGVGLAYSDVDRDFFPFEVPTYDLPLMDQIQRWYVTVGKPSGEVMGETGFTRADVDRWELLS
jgi:hypothetical protein